MTEDASLVARHVRLARPPAGGGLSVTDFEVVTRGLPPLVEGQFVVRNTWLSVDASTTLRISGGGGGYLAPIAPGASIDGWAVGTVTHSRSSDFPAGARVLHHQGWRDHAVLDDGASGWGSPELLPDDGMPDESYLGVLGPTGLTAWAGHELRKPYNKQAM